MARFYPHSKTIYLPVPSWGNHTPLFRDSGLEVKGYRYFDKSTVGLDFAGLKEDLQVSTVGRVFATLSIEGCWTERCAWVYCASARVRTQPYGYRPNGGAVDGDIEPREGEEAVPIL